MAPSGWNIVASVARIEMGSEYCDAGHARDGGYQVTSSFRKVVREPFRYLRPRLSDIRVDDREGEMNSNIEHGGSII